MPTTPHDFSALQAEWRGARMRAFDAAWKQPLPDPRSLPVAQRDDDESDGPDFPRARAHFWRLHLAGLLAFGFGLLGWACWL